MDNLASDLYTCKTFEIKDVSVYRVEHDWCKFTEWLQLRRISYELCRKYKL